MDIWLPAGESARRVAQQEALLQQMLVEHERLQAWTRELKRIDERLELVRAQENARVPGLKPGYYHVMRTVPDGPPFLKVVEGPNGEYREPDSALFQELKEWDCWDDRVTRDREERSRRIEAAHERQRSREHEDKLAEVMDRLKSHNNPGISFANQGKGWSYRAGRT